MESDDAYWQYCANLKRKKSNQEDHLTTSLINDEDRMPAKNYDPPVKSIQNNFAISASTRDIFTKSEDNQDNQDHQDKLLNSLWDGHQ